MAVQSIWAPVQIGNLTCDHFFDAPREMTFGKMNSVGKLNDLA